MPLSALEGKVTTFTSGKWKGGKAILYKRSKKGIWSIKVYLYTPISLPNGRIVAGIHKDSITDQELMNTCCDEIKTIIRDFKINKIL